MYHLFLILSLLYVNAQDIATAVANNTEFRSYVASENSATNSITLAGAKASLSADGIHASGNQDAAAFKFVAAGFGSPTPQVAIGHTILDASASVSWAPTPQGGSLIYPVPGSWAEIIAGLNQLFLYQERNGIPGFQYDIGDDVWDCTVSTGKDCFLPNSNIDLTQDVIWSPLTSSSLPCPASTGYSGNCSIWRISSTASLVQTGTSVLQITLKLASQNVLYGSSTPTQIGPDISKADFNITYPWADKAQNKSIGNVALGGYTGGKAGVGISNGSYQSKQAWIFPGNNGKSAVLAFDASATADGIVKSTKICGISGAAITSYNNSFQSLLSAAVTTQWKFSLTLASAGGSWFSELFFLSWDSVGPTSLVYDPVVGSTDSSNSSFSSNSTNSTVPSPVPSPAGSVPQPSSGSQPQPPQPPAYSQPQPPAYSKPQPSSGSPPQPSSGTQPQPSSGTQPQPSSGTQPQPPSSTQPQPTSSTQPQPPSGTQPQPPSGTQPQTPPGPPPSSPSPSGSLFLAPTLFTCLLCLIFYGLF